MLSGKPRRRTRAPRHLGCGLQHNRHYQTPGFYLNSLLISPLRLRYRRASLRTTGFGVSRTLFPRDTFLQEFWSPPEFLAKCRVFSLLNLLNQSGGRLLTSETGEVFVWYERLGVTPDRQVGPRVAPTRPCRLLFPCRFSP